MRDEYRKYMDSAEPDVVWSEDRFRLEVWHLTTEKVHPAAFTRERLGYRFYAGEELLFEGDDFRPSPFVAWDGTESITSLLYFLSLRPGDTDESYFEDYTERQREWVESEEAEDLAHIVFEIEEGLRDLTTD